MSTETGKARSANTMEFTVSKSDLVRELNLSQGVVEKKTTIPILSNVLLEASGDRITLTATDLELSIRCSCPARVKKEGSGTVRRERHGHHSVLACVQNVDASERRWGDPEHVVPGRIHDVSRVEELRLAPQVRYDRW